jgi:hypothetical protein
VLGRMGLKAGRGGERPLPHRTQQAQQTAS